MDPAAATFDTQNLDRFLQRVQSYTRDLIFTQKGVEQVHHYTDLGGLSGIIGRQDLWLTHARFSNDDEEMTHGYGVAQAVIDERLTRADPASKLYLERLRAAVTTPEPEPVYICCFCKSGDLLSQWRGYGANGNGVSLAFDPAAFDFVTGPDSPGFGLVRLWSVFYDPAVQQSIMESAVEFGLHEGIGLDDQVRRASEAIRFFIPTFKNEAFSEEGELRLIFTPNAAAVPAPPEPEFREARGMLIPYYRLQALRNTSATPPARLPIVGVCIGPGPRKELNAQSARMLLSSAAMPKVNVEVSTTPYRG